MVAVDGRAGAPDSTGNPLGKVKGEVVRVKEEGGGGGGGGLESRAGGG